MIRRRLNIPATAERVWDALTEPDQVAGWFGGEMDWTLEAGSSLRFRGNDGQVRDGTILEVRPGRFLRFEWWPSRASQGETSGDAGPADPGEVSEVSYLLEPTAGATVLTVQEAPLAAAGSQARATSGPTCAAGWTDWDDRLAGAWAGLEARHALHAPA
jgi:uncharacterized protein YndB with AHSA1/START domain